MNKIELLGNFTVLDLVSSELREILETTNTLHTPNASYLIQKYLSNEAKLMIDAVHLIFCSSEACEYYDEESKLETWTLPMHVQMTDFTVELLNKTEMTINDFGEVLRSYLQFIKLITLQPKVLKLVEFSYFNTEKNLTFLSQFPV